MLSPVEKIQIAEVFPDRGARGLIQLQQRHQPILLRKRQRPQQHRVHQAENCGSGADSERQRQNSGNGEAGALAELAEGKTQVLEESWHWVQ